MNQLILCGFLTNDPKITQTEAGNVFCKIPIAVDRERTFKNEKETDFFEITAWGKLAEFCGRYLKKGRKILVVATLQITSYERNGQKSKYYNITANHIEFASDKGNVIVKSDIENDNKPLDTELDLDPLT